jgi:hypothetical protein
LTADFPAIFAVCLVNCGTIKQKSRSTVSVVDAEIILELVKRVRIITS